MVKGDSMLSEHEYLFGKKKDASKIIDMKSSEDFPTLLGGGPGLDLGAQITASNKRGKPGQ